MLLLVDFLFLCLVAIKADIYMHNPRGSNNRLDEQGRERANANRMFDSQNNNRGGYNVGSLYYYTSSQLAVEWTNQHECGGANTHCDIIIQYMCHPWLRDGTVTATIPERKYQCQNFDCNTDLEYGMNENYDYYVNCKYRKRNKGLFTADQNLKGDSAIYTRQNPNGNRRGYECPEERDYYPYWLPTPWKDIAVLTNDISKCEHFLNESQNTQDKYYCEMPPAYQRELKKITIPKNIPKIPITQSECEQFEYPRGSNKTGVWKKQEAWNLPAPECILSVPSRDNHLGDTYGGFPAMYNMSFFDDPNQSCAMRIRYNISTNDYDPANTTAAQNKKKRNEPANLDIGKLVGLSTDEAKSRGYVFKNNPAVQVFGDELGGDLGKEFQLRLAINTAQYGRTFQDRSHSIAIREPPADSEGEVIHNLNVKGKRGNIVQVYPAVEYDFIPNRLQISNGDLVHIQWTGSNTNPNNNDGQGLRGTDRSNMVQIAKQRYPEGTPGRAVPEDLKFGHWGVNYPEHLNRAKLLGLSRDDMKRLAILQPGQFGGEMSELDDAGTYFDLGLRTITSPGTYHYMCTRNNNFSNRSQKGKIIVTENLMRIDVIGPTGGMIRFDKGNQGVWVSAGTLKQATPMVVENWPAEAGQNVIRQRGGDMNAGDAYGSDFVVVQPFDKVEKAMTIKIRLNDTEATVYQSTDYKNWQSADCSMEGSIAVCSANSGGLFVARKSDKSKTAIIIGVVVALVAIIALVAAVYFYFKRRPESAAKMRARFTELKFSTQKQI